VPGLERSSDPDKGLARVGVEAFLADEHASELDGRIGQGVTFDGVGRVPVDENRQVVGTRNATGEAGEAAISIGSAVSFRLPISHIAEDDLVNAQWESS
jgi:hypothetical protein